MLTTLKHIVSLLLAVIFLTPSIVKLEHHHESVDCLSNCENHFDTPHKNCYVCKFEFSVFSTEKAEIDLQTEKPNDRFRNDYQSLSFPDNSQFSFLLRAPPAMTI